jgi:hypothetical protein
MELGVDMEGFADATAKIAGLKRSATISKYS